MLENFKCLNMEWLDETMEKGPFEYKN